MTESPIATLPSKALPLHEAMEAFLPKELWAEYARAIKALEEKKWPVRPSYFSMHGREWREAMEWYEVAIQPAREAEASLNRIRAQMTRAVVEQLIEGHLIAFAQTEPPFGAWRPIPAAAWHNLKIKDVRHGRVIGPNVDLTGLQVMAVDRSVAHVMSTGKQGQPNKGIHFIMAEFERRHDAGDTERSRMREAERLLAWFRTHHPDKQPPTAKTIYNNLPAGIFPPVMK